MPASSAPIPPADWPQLELENAQEYLAYLGTSPLVESHRADDLTWVITGIADNTFNGVAWTHLTESTAAAQIPDILQHFRVHDVPALWYVASDSQPATLGDLLQANGCERLDSGISMTAHLNTLNETARPIDNLVIKPVATAADLAHWCEVYEHERHLREPLYTSLGLTDQPLRHYLALLDGLPVATASIFLGNRTVGLYHVEVIPSVQKRGIGTAIVLTALHHARSLGYHVAALAPTPEAFNMYQRLGFVMHHNTYQMYAI
jgi:GNAT superfamily N-acetyltransferase